MGMTERHGPRLRQSLRQSAALLLAAAALMASATLTSMGRAEAAEKAKEPRPVQWSWEGPLGTYDRASMQRGLQVYREVCKTCHSLHFVAIRSLGDAGGPGFNEAEVKAIAASYEKEIIDDTGETKTVPRTPADTLPDPYPNEQTARAANNGALPPDLSLITKARERGPDYVYSLLTGFADPPAGMTMREGMHYNAYFAGYQIAMAPPLSPDQVTYADGTKATVEQMAHDVTTFLQWASEPKLEARKRIGINVMIYLGILTVLLFWSYRRIWHGKH